MDEQIVKLLTSIEKLLKTATATSSSTNTGGLKSLFSSKAAQLKQDRDEKSGQKIFKTITSDVRSTDKAVLALTQSIVSLNKEVGKTSVSFSTLQSQMAKFGATLGVQAAPIPGLPKAGGQQPGVMPASRNQGGASPTNHVLGNMINRLGATGVSLGFFESAVKNAAVAVKKLTADFFQLSRIGLGSVSTLKQMSIDAVLAGMSLQEYTQLVKENTAFASRAGSLENFAKIASASDGMLASMGIFGAEARDLQASLANSNTLAGVSGNKLAEAGAAQIKMFDKLRKSTNMTANEFATLVKSVSENENTQRELVGLAPAEKRARMAELLNITTTGQRLGLTGRAAEELASALIAQRKETVANRFESAGRVMQLGAFTGQGAEAQRAAELIRKGRRRSDTETEEMRSLLQGLDKASQGLYELGDFAVQNVIDQLGPDTGQGLGGAGEIMKASRAVENTAASGAVFNRDFGQHVGAFGQAVGNAIALFRGFDQSAGPAIATAVGSAILLAFRGPIIGLLRGALGLGTAGVAAGASAAGSVGGVVSSIVAGAQGLATGLMSAAKYFKPAVGFFSALIELFTGEVSDALNPSGGFFSRLGGMVTAYFTAIPNMIFDLLGYVFGESFGNGLQNKFDQIVAVVNATFREFFGGIFQTVAQVLSWVLPKDSGLLKSLEKWTENTRTAADENWQAFDKLSENGQATLKTIAADNKKLADSAVAATTSATTKATAATEKFNNVQLGNTIAAGQVMQDARTILAQPQVQVPQSVKPAAVNTPENAAPAATGAEATTTDNSEMVTLLNSILQVLKSSLSIEEAQVKFAEQMVQRTRAPAGFVPAEVTANRLLKQG